VRRAFPELTALLRPRIADFRQETGSNLQYQISNLKFQMKSSHKWSDLKRNSASGAKALVCRALNVAAEAATHKDYL
jgi:hypothetical protein